MDTWDEAHETQRTRPTTAAGVVAGLVLLGAALAAWEGTAPLSGSDDDALTIESGVPPPEGPEDVFGVPDEPPARPPEAGEWRPMADAPLAPRVSPVAAWTGKQLLVWGGFSQQRWIDPRGGGSGLGGEDFIPLVDGAAYDPASDSWRVLPQAPLPAEGLGQHSGAWTGRELLVIGDEGAAAYTPAADEWRQLSDPPDSARWRWDTAVWTGGELVVLSGGRSPAADDESAAVAYDPKADAWRSLPAPPITDSRTAALNGRMVVYGEWWGTWGIVHAITSYDSSADSWSEPDQIPVPAGVGSAIAAVAADPVRDRVVLVGARHVGEWRPFLASWRPVAGWRTLPDLPPPEDTAHEVFALRGGTLVWLPAAGQGLLFSYEGWRDLPDPGLGGRRGSTAEWTGDELFVWGGMSARAFHDDGARWRLHHVTHRAVTGAAQRQETRGEWPFAASPD